MESTWHPTPEEAREQLRAVERAQSAVRSADVPLWLVLANAVLLPLAVLSQLRDDYAVPLGAVAVPLVAIFNGVAINRLGVARSLGRSSGTWGTLALSVLLVAGVGASFFLYRATDEPAVVVAVAVLVGLLVLVVGLGYRRRAARKAA